MNDHDEKNLTNRSAFGDDILGVNSEIARKLRQFYLEIQEEALPVHLIELLDKLDQVEQLGLNNVKRFDPL
ncbi:NepR family anti-sigma factor [Bartonella sp. B41]